MSTTGRNDPCPCGSGKKYKKCCLLNQSSNIINFSGKKIDKIEKDLIEPLYHCLNKYYGEEALPEAWDEFTLFSGKEMDFEGDYEVGALFLPWFFYQWLPLNEPDDAKPHPEQTIALTFLEKNANTLSQLQKQFIQSVCNQAYSFMVVTKVVYGKSLTLKDLFLDQTYTINDKQTSEETPVGEILFCKVVCVDGIAIMVGCSCINIPSDYSSQILEIRDYLSEADEQNVDLQFLHDNAIALRNFYFGIKEALDNPLLPTITNTDGELLQPTKLYYQLNSSVDSAFHALKTLAKNWSEQDFFDNENTIFDKHNQLQSIHIPWLETTKIKQKQGHATELGYLKISEDQLIIEVNSDERAEQIKRKISRRLGKDAIFKHAAIESLENMMPNNALDAIDDARLDALKQSPEIQTLLKEFSQQHWQEWIDMPLPALKDKTPLQAAKTKIGRERLETLFLEFSQIDDQQNPFAPDIALLKSLLKLQ